jgi:Flp pilus assembly protein TadG
MKLSDVIAKFRSDARGVAAVEFALVTPAIAGVALTSFMVWETGSRHRDMTSALRVGAEYYLNGGTDDAKAVASATEAWSRKLTGGEIVASRVCRCGDVVVECTAMCSASKPPAIYVTLRGSGAVEGSVVKTLVAEQVVRVR